MQTANVSALAPRLLPERAVITDRLLNIQTRLLRAEGLARLVAHYAHGLHSGELPAGSAWHAEEGAETLAELLVSIHDEAAAVAIDREVRP